MWKPVKCLLVLFLNLPSGELSTHFFFFFKEQHLISSDVTFATGRCIQMFLHKKIMPPV